MTEDAYARIGISEPWESSGVCIKFPCSLLKHLGDIIYQPSSPLIGPKYHGSVMGGTNIQELISNSPAM